MFKYDRNFHIIEVHLFYFKPLFNTNLLRLCNVRNYETWMTDRLSIQIIVTMLCHQLKRVSHIESVEYVLKSYREQGQFLPAGQRSLRTYSCIPAYIDITVA